MNRRLPQLLLGSALTMVSCGGEDPVVARIAPPPMAEASPSVAAPYAFGRSARLERLVQKLMGQGTSASWNFAKSFLAREDDPELTRELIRYFEEQRLSTGETAGLRNTVHVMSASGRTVFAEPLLKLDDHSSAEVRDEAMRAMIRCASPEVIETLASRFEQVDVRRRAQYMRIFARKLEPDRVARMFRSVLGARLTPERASEMRDQVLIALQQDDVPKETIRKCLAGMLGSYPKRQQMDVAILMHGAGSEEGRVALMQMLREVDDPAKKAGFVLALATGSAPEAMPTILELSDTEHPMLLGAVASYLGTVTAEGGASPEQVANAQRTLVFLAESEIEAVRNNALHALGERSRSIVVPRLERAIRSGTGSELRQAIATAIEIREASLVGDLVERLGKAAGPERRLFLQGLGRIGSPDCVEPLLAEFRAPPRVIQAKSGLDTVSYSMIQLANVEAAFDPLLALHAELAKAAADDEEAALRRAHVRHGLALLSKSETVEESRSKRTDRAREFFLEVVQSDLPARERLHALSLLKASIRLEDVSTLLRILREEKDVQFRRQLNDFLWEFF